MTAYQRGVRLTEVIGPGCVAPTGGLATGELVVVLAAGALVAVLAAGVLAAVLEATAANMVSAEWQFGQRINPAPANGITVSGDTSECKKQYELSRVTSSGSMASASAAASVVDAGAVEASVVPEVASALPGGEIPCWWRSATNSATFMLVCILAWGAGGGK